VRPGRSTPVIHIEPPRAWETPDLRQVWRFRELLYFLAWRAIKVRYKQTLIGAAWAILQPVLSMAVFSLIFGGLLGVPSEGVPYPIFSYAALLPWTFFAAAVTLASNSLVYDANLISKVYFPRLIIPLAATVPPAIDLAIAFLVLVAMLAFYGIVPGAAVIALPLLLLLAWLTALGVGLWLSALNVKYRDVAYVVPFLVQVWFFVTPVLYPSSLIPDPFKPLYGLNPMVGVIDGFRWALLGAEHGPDVSMLVSIGTVAALLVSGLFYFRRTESQFADVV
jgi:lipopolysaccharide transport system permease protein